MQSAEGVDDPAIRRRCRRRALKALKIQPEQTWPASRGYHLRCWYLRRVPCQFARCFDVEFVCLCDARRWIGRLN